MKRLSLISTFLICLFSTGVFAQNNPDLKQRGFSAYKPYDKSFITTDIRGKHAVSIGPLLSLYGQNMEDFDPSFGAHIGYNYLVIERREIKLSRKTKFRNEVKFGFGLHLNILDKNQQMLLLNFYRPFSAIKGKIFSWYFFSSYTLGWHKVTNGSDDIKPNKFNFGLEVLRLRFGKLPMHLHLGINYDLSNNFLGTDRLNGGVLFGLRYHIFKN
ncbi:MAG: hypothetical protein GQ574_09530 [Crocinitomix sp.]|nr:hypothetical protein [Crocinitomix sp.]